MGKRNQFLNYPQARRELLDLGTVRVPRRATKCCNLIRLMVAGCLILACVQVGMGADFYVSPNGSGMGDGSITKPWDLQTALSQPAAVKPGDIVWLRAGTYVGKFASSLKGAIGNPIIVRQYPGERAVLDGNDGAANNYPTLKIGSSGYWTWYWDFEVKNSNTARTASVSGSTKLRGSAIELYGSNIKLISLILHDADMGVDFWTPGENSEIYGCLIYYNGWEGPDRGHGHGIYSHNQTGTKLITNNVIFDQFSHGVHNYNNDPSSYIDNIVVTGTTSFSNGVLSRVTGYARNILYGGKGIAHNPTITGNYTYFPGTDGENNLGYSAGSSNATVDDNYFAGGTALKIVNSSNISSIAGNTFYGGISGFTSSDYPSNSYTTTRPTGVKMFVRPNRYEPGRANITIFNWNRSGTVSVDVSAVGLAVGDTYEIRNVQDYFNDVITGVYAGGSVSIPMTGHTVATPVGWTAPPSTLPEFGAFVLRKLDSGSSDTTSPVISAVHATGITSNGATISWTTNEASDSLVEYGTSTAYGSPTTINASLVTSHSQSLNGLVAGTLYHYRVKSRDVTGNAAASGDFTFTTLNAPDTTPPVISGVTSSSITTNSATITWNTDEDSDSQVEYGLSTSYGSLSNLVSTLSRTHSINLASLGSGKTYYYRVKSKDAAGNLATSGNSTFVTVAGDTLPPADVQNFTAAPGNGQITLTWTNPADADFKGVMIRYRTDGIFPTSNSDGVLTIDRAELPSTSDSFLHSGLNDGMTYYYSAFTYDTSQNYSMTAHAQATPINLTILSLSPSQGTIGTTVVISGMGFGDQPGNGTVTFSGFSAAVSTWTDTSITTAVPSNATSGPVVVTLNGIQSNSINFKIGGRLAAPGRFRIKK